MAQKNERRGANSSMESPALMPAQSPTKHGQIDPRTSAAVLESVRNREGKLQLGIRPSYEAQGGRGEDKEQHGPSCMWYPEMEMLLYLGMCLAVYWKMSAIRRMDGAGG